MSDPLTLPPLRGGPLPQPVGSLCDRTLSGPTAKRSAGLCPEGRGESSVPSPPRGEGQGEGATADPRAFIVANTAVEAPPLVPEIRLHLATEITPLWQATEATLGRDQLPPPYWAFAWAGGQALARHVLDHPDLVRGKRVLDFGAGSGLLALAAGKAGAAETTAAEIDAFAAAAIALNAALNDVAVIVETADLIGREAAPWNVVLVGDMCYERPLAERLTAWLRRLAAQGTLVLLGDPGRNYLPQHGLTEIARYEVPTPLDLEDRTMREGVVWRLEE